MKHHFIRALLILLLGVLFNPVLQAQEKNYVPGRLIIQFAPGAEVGKASLLFSFNYANLRAERCLSEDLGIWLYSYSSSSDAKALLHALKLEKSVAQVQFDHYIGMRDILPDDPSFAMQWALYNIGQLGGVADADIDATKAWEVNVNNGLTAFGDTIVIAVVDDGFDLSHEDMNFWKNRSEIPENGIDDDENGYIDDYHGWNAKTATGELPERSHGTRVAGVAGAVGNNGIGISGVGWNCKVMPITGSSTFESTVVAAFSYVYKMRSLYEESDGEKGAYIVVTNGSFGVDFGNPENYPIWGMMYDSLGSLGILNSAATMNHESNVDIVGDVPTNFDSDYIIGVTNTTTSDRKYDVAAWGMNSIDLGAPGSNILSTRLYDTYGYSTGTSLAAPQLSGSIALLFAAADEQFLQKYEEEPGVAAVFLKNIILDEVDSLPGFDTMCTSAGRLNVDKAMRALLSPRMSLEADTLRIFLRPDSSANSMVLMTNLSGFELGYTAGFDNLPEWIEYYTAEGSLPGNGYENLDIGFNTDGLGYGVYTGELNIRDDGGWLIPLHLELNVVDDTDIEENDAQGVLKAAYPNPFSNMLSLSLNIADQSTISFCIYSLSGDLVDSRELNLDHGEHQLQWNAGQLPSGIYIIELKGKGFSDQMKVIKSSN